jgi:hypothetical protein
MTPGPPVANVANPLKLCELANARIACSKLLMQSVVLFLLSHQALEGRLNWAAIGPDKGRG